MNEAIRVRVVAREHANQDSLPLRFGIHFESDADIAIEEVIDLGVDDRYPDRHHYEGVLRNPDSEKRPSQRGHFVLGFRQRDNYWSLVTAWCNGNKDDEYFLSNTMRNLREDGILNPKMLLEMHPAYRNGEINSSASLIRYLSKHMAKDEILRARESEKRSRLQTEEALDLMKQAHKSAEAAKRQAEHSKTIAMEAIETVEILEGRVNKAEEAEREARRLLAEALQAISTGDAEQLEKGPTGTAEAERVVLPARAVTQMWRSKTGSDYRNLGIEADVIDVLRVGESKIRLTYVGKSGENVTVDDFGYQGFVKPVFEYLSSRKGKRAVFLVTQKPGNPVKLAADTMMLPPYKGLWS